MKRLLDLTVTIPLVIVLTPVMAVVGIVVFAADRGPGAALVKANRAWGMLVHDAKVPLDEGRDPAGRN